MSSLGKMLGVLELFDDRTLFVRCEDVERALDCSRATAYRYLTHLADVGLVTPTSDSKYVLGARIVELDRLLRRNDPMLRCARPVMDRVASETGLNMLLCSYYGDRVMCVHAVWPDTSIEQRYERGKPMPLFQGALAKIILAHLQPHQLKNTMLWHAEEIRAAGLGRGWDEYRAIMMQLRAEGSCVTRGEIAPESVGVAAAVLSPAHRVLGSIVFAIPNKRFDEIGEDYARSRITQAADAIREALAQSELSEEAGGARTRPAKAQSGN